MLEIFKSEGYLKVYKGLTLNERINDKYVNLRALINSIAAGTGETYLQEILPKIDRT